MSEEELSSPVKRYDLEILTGTLIKRLDGHGNDIRALWTDFNLFRKELHEFYISVIKDQNNMNQELVEKIHSLEKGFMSATSMSDQLKKVSDENAMISRRMDRIEKKNSRSDLSGGMRNNRAAKYIGIGSAVSGIIYFGKLIFSYVKGTPPPQPPTTPLF